MASEVLQSPKFIESYLAHSTSCSFMCVTNQRWRCFRGRIITIIPFHSGKRSTEQFFICSRRCFVGRRAPASAACAWCEYGPATLHPASGHRCSGSEGHRTGVHTGEAGRRRRTRSSENVILFFSDTKGSSIKSGSAPARELCFHLHGWGFFFFSLGQFVFAVGWKPVGQRQRFN